MSQSNGFRKSTPPHRLRIVHYDQLKQRVSRLNLSTNPATESHLLSIPSDHFYCSAPQDPFRSLLMLSTVESGPVTSMAQHCRIPADHLYFSALHQPCEAPKDRTANRKPQTVNPEPRHEPYGPLLSTDQALSTLLRTATPLVGIAEFCRLI